MRARIFTAAVLTVSLLANVFLMNERLEKKFYQKGIKDGVSRIGETIVKEVAQKGQLTVKMNDGRQVTLKAPVKQALPDAVNSLPFNPPVSEVNEP